MKSYGLKGRRINRTRTKRPRTKRPRTKRPRTKGRSKRIKRTKRLLRGGSTRKESSREEEDACKNKIYVSYPNLSGKWAVAVGNTNEWVCNMDITTPNSFIMISRQHMKRSVKGNVDQPVYDQLAEAVAPMGMNKTLYEVGGGGFLEKNGFVAINQHDIDSTGPASCTAYWEFDPKLFL